MVKYPGTVVQRKGCRMSLVLIYYLEINTVCMIILGIIRFLYSREKRGKAESPWYKALLWGLILYCITDIGRYCLAGSRLKNQRENGMITEKPISLSI